MSRFIVKTHHMIAKTDLMPMGVFWQNGVFLRTGQNANLSEALCEFDNDARTLSITVRAAFPQNMIEQLHGFAKAVFNFFKGLEPLRGYGCVKFHDDGQEEQCDNTHPENDILYALSNMDKISCSSGWHKVDPVKLVSGFNSFREIVFTRADLQAELEKKPGWTKGLFEDVKDLLVFADNSYDKLMDIRQQQELLPAKLKQQLQMQTRNYLQRMDKMLDDREFTSAPGIIGIGTLNGEGFSVKKLFESEYVLTPYCEFEGAIHRCSNASVIFKMPREWFEKSGPMIASAVNWLGAGIKLAIAAGPLLAGTEGAALYAMITNELNFMKALAGHLKLTGPVDSDIDEMGHAFIRRLNGVGLDDLREDTVQKHLLRTQLGMLLKQLAPDRYEAKQWGDLKRIRMGDDSYRWLCADHSTLLR
jgi:hypothetical protein